MAMDTGNAYFRPASRADWEKWRPIFTRLYYEEARPLSQVMKIMEDQHRVRASEKMYKNKVKAWKLRKYLKEDEAKQIVNGEALPSEIIHVPALAGDADEARKRAEKSLKRKRARERAHSQPDPDADADADGEVEELPILPEHSSEMGNAMVPWSSPTPQSFHINDVAEKFLFNLRAWTHEAFFSGHWDSKMSAQHHSGRQASRQLSSDLTAGTNLFEKAGKQKLAWKYWNRAVAHFQSPDLFKTWYHETPIRLLFEVGRLTNKGHGQLAAVLLRSIRDWAHKFLDKNDSRYALFSVFGELEVEQLRHLYGLAALCLYNGLESRVEKHSPLLYDVRLNRALDLLGFDPDSDLAEWLPPIEEVDQSCGPSNAYSVYFLLLEAYRSVAQDRFDEAEAMCQEVSKRLAAMEEGTIDTWRVGLAYRRLGRQQYSKGRYADARRSFNTALKNVGIGNRTSASILIEICQCQENMANAMDDKEDALIWSHMLRQLETTKDEVVPDIPVQPRLMPPPNDAFVINGNKKRRLSPSPSRSMTM